MRKPIKIHIKIRKPLGINWVRFHIVEKLILEANGPIQTEAQLCYYMYKNFGPGRFQIIAWQKGHEGFWLFWLGNLYVNGFERDRNRSKETEKLKKALIKADSFEEKQDIEEEIETEQEMFKEEKKYKRRGPFGLKTSKVGQLNSYEPW